MRTAALALVLLTNPLLAQEPVKLVREIHGEVCEDDREGRSLDPSDEPSRDATEAPAPANAAALGWGRPIRKVDRAPEASEREACPPEISA